MPLSTALAFLEFNGDGLAILVIGPAIVGIVALLLAIGLFVGAQKPETSRGVRIALNILAVTLLVIALGIGACFGVFLVG